MNLLFVWYSKKTVWFSEWAHWLCMNPVLSKVNNLLHILNISYLLIIFMLFLQWSLNLDRISVDYLRKMFLVPGWVQEFSSHCLLLKLTSLGPLRKRVNNCESFMILNIQGVQNKMSLLDKGANLTNTMSGAYSLSPSRFTQLKHL